MTWDEGSITNDWSVSIATQSNNCIATFNLENNVELQDNTRTLEVTNANGEYLEEWNLTDLDQIREDILKAGNEQFIISSSREDIFGSLIRRIGGEANTPLRTTRPQVG